MVQFDPFSDKFQQKLDEAVLHDYLMSMLKFIKDRKIVKYKDLEKTPIDTLKIYINFLLLK